MSIEARIRGNLTKDPEFKYVTVSGEQRRVVELRVFSDEYRRGPDDQLYQDDERSCGVDVSIWQERLGDQILGLLKKGCRVEAFGSMYLHRYKDRDTGEPRAGLQMAAESLTLVLTRVESIQFAARRERPSEDTQAQAA